MKLRAAGVSPRESSLEDSFEALLPLSCRHSRAGFKPESQHIRSLKGCGARIVFWTSTPFAREFSKVGTESYRGNIGRLSFDKKALCVGNSFKKENSLNVSCSCRNTNDNLHLQDLPIAFCKLCQQNFTAVGNKNFDSSILQISEDGQGIVTDTVCYKKLIQGQCVIC